MIILIVLLRKYGDDASRNKWKSLYDVMVHIFNGSPQKPKRQHVRRIIVSAFNRLVDLGPGHPSFGLRETKHKGEPQK